MEPIGPLNPVLDALRRQLAENIDRMRKAGKLAAAGSAQAAREPAGAGGAEALEAALRRRLAPIERRTAEGRAAATRVFVETVLVAEFGRGLLSDPALGDMLAEVSAALREDSDVREKLDAMLAEL
jgi:hypothetical protein